jgi:hypothetical protein
MLIWILALVLFACLASAGFTLGVVRVAFSLVGLLVGVVLMGPLGHVMHPLLGVVGVKNPILLWLLGPILVLVIVLVVFKVIGLFVHRKVDVYYKYKAGDLKQGLWKRLNPRIGLCLGLVNAAVYLILISLLIYVVSYATTQVVTGDDAATSVKLVNSAGKDLQSSGMAKIAAAIDPTPDTYYQAADLVGLIYHNDLLEGRLSRYPAFLSLGERPEFQAIANDQAFTELRQRQPPLSEVLKNPNAQAIVNNPDLLKEVWGIVMANMQDLKQFLMTGQSAKYDEEKILGRWSANVNLTLAELKRTRPNISPTEMKQVKRIVAAVFEKTTLVAAPDKQVYLKNVGKVKLGAPGAPPPATRGARPAAGPANVPLTVDFQSFKGEWSPDGMRYHLSFADKGGGAMEASVENDRLTVTGESYPMVFDREY